MKFSVNINLETGQQTVPYDIYQMPATVVQQPARQRGRLPSRDWLLTGGTVALAALFLFPPTATFIKSSTPALWLQSAVGQSSIEKGKAANVVRHAMTWVQEHKEFNPGQTAQCAAFVRQVFKDAGVKIGITSQPWDAETGGYNGPLMARSFFGDDIGKRISRNQIQPGDLIAFTGTYGEFKGTAAISHVGIATSATMMIDRPTADKPVKYRRIFGTFPNSSVMAIRPFAYTK